MALSPLAGGGGLPSAVGRRQQPFLSKIKRRHPGRVFNSPAPSRPVLCPIRRRIEPFYASAVVLDGGAVAFLGGNGFGKSTLTTAFLGRGYPMLAGSLLAFREKGCEILAYPGRNRSSSFRKL